MDINQEYKEIIFKEFIGRSNTGKYVSLSEFKEEGSMALLKDDNNPATRPIPDEKYCEFCMKDLTEILSHESSQKNKKDDLKCKSCFRVRYCDKTCQRKHLEIHQPNCKIQCEVIFTYAYKNLQGQEAYNIYMDKDITEKEFVKTILDTIPLKSKNMHDLQHLVKLSTCTFKGNNKGIYTFRDKNNGKYYFNNKISPAPSTKIWEKFLKEYILSK